MKRRYTHSLIRGPSRARKWPLLCSCTPPDLLTTMRIISPNNMAGSTVLHDELSMCHDVPDLAFHHWCLQECFVAEVPNLPAFASPLPEDEDLSD